MTEAERELREQLALLHDMRRDAEAWSEDDWDAYQELEDALYDRITSSPIR